MNKSQNPAFDPTSAANRHLPLPPRVPPITILWTYAIPIVLLHVLAAAVVLPWLFSWTALAVCLIGVVIFGQGINLCYHRLLTHRSFQVPRPLEHALVVLALCCLEDTPARWVATHRHHHNHSDEQPDPHSPLVTFLWSHVGWLLVHNRDINRTLFQKYARDMLADPFYMALEKKPQRAFYIYLAHAALFFLAGFVAVLALSQELIPALQMGLSMLVWGVFLRTVLVWHITWSVNSLTHLFGYRNHPTDENSRNNWLVGILAMGEGWHNNHHDDPASASVQEHWWEIDVTYYMIRLLESVGLAHHVVPQRSRRLASRTTPTTPTTAEPASQ